MYTRQVWLSVLVAVFLVPLGGVQLGQVGSNPLPEKISGSWSDACPCSTPCPCWRTGRANVPHCLNVQVYELGISNSPGEQRPAFVLVGNSEGYWPPSQYVLYVNDSVEAAVVRKMADFLRDEYGVDAQVSSRVPIRKKASSTHTRHFEIPGILSYNIESSFPTKMSETAREGLYRWLFNPEQWRTRSVSYRVPGGRVVEYKRTNALVAEFQLASENLQTSHASPSIPFVPPREDGSPRVVQRIRPQLWAPCGNAELFKGASQHIAQIAGLVRESLLQSAQPGTAVPHQHE